MADTERRITKIVLTGGPCGGKSSAIDAIKAFLKEHGYHVLAVPEMATLLFVQGGIPIQEAKWPYLQKTIAKVQHAMELAYYQYAIDLLTLSPETPIVIIFDRGIFDGKAYISDEIFRDYLQFAVPGVDTLKTDQLMNDKYDMVIHLTTAAKGAERFYRKEIFRNESPSVARELDEKILKIYAKHKDHRIIDNGGCRFEDKLNAVIGAIADKLNITESTATGNVPINVNSTQSQSMHSISISEEHHISTKSRKRFLNLPTDSGISIDEEIKVPDPTTTEGAFVEDLDALKETVESLKRKNQEQLLEIERLKAQLILKKRRTVSGKISYVADSKMSNSSFAVDHQYDANRLKSWMEGMKVFDETLFRALVARNVKSHQLLRAFPQNELDCILRNVRADQLTKMKHPMDRNSIDEKLIRFEKACRSIPKTALNV